MEDRIDPCPVCGAVVERLSKDRPDDEADFRTPVTASRVGLITLHPCGHDAVGRAWPDEGRVEFRRA